MQIPRQAICISCAGDFLRLAQSAAMSRPRKAKSETAPIRRNRLRELRTKNRWTLEQVGERAGMSAAQVSRLERSKSGLTMPTLDLFAKVYECSREEIIADTSTLRTSPINVRGAVEAGRWELSWEWPESEWYRATVPVETKYEAFPKFGLLVRGEAMNRVYPDGAVLVCILYSDLGAEPRPGERVIVERTARDSDRKEATVRELRLDARGDPWLWPDSTDPEHQAPVRNSRADGVRVVAKVIGSYRPEPEPEG